MISVRAITFQNLSRAVDAYVAVCSLLLKTVTVGTVSLEARILKTGRSFYYRWNTCTSFQKLNRAVDANVAGCSLLLKMVTVGTVSLEARTLKPAGVSTIGGTPARAFRS